MRRKHEFAEGEDLAFSALQADLALPLLSTQAQVLTCVDRGGCSEAELLRADRAANATTVAAGGQGSDKVANLAAAALVSIGIGVEHRLRGKRPSTALLDRAGGQFAALQVQISEELDPG